MAVGRISTPLAPPLEAGNPQARSVVPLSRGLSGTTLGEEDDVAAVDLEAEAKQNRLRSSPVPLPPTRRSQDAVPSPVASLNIPLCLGKTRSKPHNWSIAESESSRTLRCTICDTVVKEKRVRGSWEHREVVSGKVLELGFMDVGPTTDTDVEDELERPVFRGRTSSPQSRVSKPQTKPKAPTTIHDLPLCENRRIDHAWSIKAKETARKYECIKCEMIVKENLVKGKWVRRELIPGKLPHYGTSVDEEEEREVESIMESETTEYVTCPEVDFDDNATVRPPSSRRRPQPTSRPPPQPPLAPIPDETERKPRIPVATSHIPVCLEQNTNHDWKIAAANATSRRYICDTCQVIVKERWPKGGNCWEAQDIMT
jgi:hypothetical protein